MYAQNKNKITYIICTLQFTYPVVHVGVQWIKKTSKFASRH